MLSEQILGLDPQEWDDEGCEDDARERSQVPSRLKSRLAGGRPYGWNLGKGRIELE